MKRSLKKTKNWNQEKRRKFHIDLLQEGKLSNSFISSTSTPIHSNTENVDEKLEKWFETNIDSRPTLVEIPHNYKEIISQAAESNIDSLFMEGFTNFLTMVMFTTKHSLQLMEKLYNEAGFIYPIAYPGLFSDGKLFRFSLTTVLPPSLDYYLSFKLGKVIQLPISYSLDVSEIIEELEKCLKECLSEEDDVLIGTKTVNPVVSNIEKNINNLKQLIPDFLRNQHIAIDNSLFCGQNHFMRLKRSGTNALLINTKEEIEKLKFYSLYCSRYISKLEEMVNSEIQTRGIVETGKVLEQIEIPEIVLFSISFQTIKMQVVIMSTAKRYNVNQFQMIKFIHLCSLALKKVHDEKLVHGDIKPEHLLFSDKKVVLIDFEFCTRVNHSILGWTNGFHPPEYDDFISNKTNEKPGATTAADIFSLGLSCLSCLGDRSVPTKRENIIKLLDTVENSKLKRIFVKMLKANPKKRIQNASELIKHIESI